MNGKFHKVLVLGLNTCLKRRIGTHLALLDDRDSDNCPLRDIHITISHKNDNSYVSNCTSHIWKTVFNKRAGRDGNFLAKPGFYYNLTFQNSQTSSLQDVTAIFTNFVSVLWYVVLIESLASNLVNSFHFWPMIYLLMTRNLTELVKLPNS